MNKQHIAELTKLANKIVKENVQHEEDWWQGYDIEGNCYDINIYEHDNELQATAYPVVNGYTDTFNGIKLKIKKGQ